MHIFADGHGMTIHDFMKSAEAVSVVIAQPDLCLGQRILTSVQATQKAVACNTNLGIILLCAPLIHAVLTVTKGCLQQRLQQVLQETTISDAHNLMRCVGKSAVRCCITARWHQPLIALCSKQCKPQQIVI